MVQRLRNWILNNQFFSYKGQFSKSAFIAMSTWAVVMVKYIAAGLSFTFTKAAAVVAGVAVPATTISYVVAFDPTAATALLTITFGLYFGGKFSPDNKKPPNGEGA